MNIDGEEIKGVDAQSVPTKCWCRTCKQDKTEAEMFAGAIHPDGVGRGLCNACRNNIINTIHGDHE